ncbi:DUF2752 domain-containing protein [Symmachiella macrocystis]|nr:DUF2752 domain-containing protein [Symmachiella macrocystis]
MAQNGLRMRNRHLMMLTTAAVVVCLAFLLEVRPDQGVQLRMFKSHPLPSSCISRDVFGVDCPGCGLTRSFVYLSHNQWAESLAVHRVGWVLAIAVLLQFPYRIAALAYHKDYPIGKPFTVWFAWGLIAMLIGNWILGFWL